MSFQENVKNAFFRNFEKKREIRILEHWSHRPIGLHVGLLCFMIIKYCFVTVCIVIVFL